MKALKTKIFKTKLNFGGCLAYFLKPYFNFNNFNFFGGCLASGGKEEILHPAGQTCILVLLLFFWGLPDAGCRLPVAGCRLPVALQPNLFINLYLEIS